MLRMMCKSKIHNLTVTGKKLHYSGSILLDKGLMKEADIKPYEIVLVVNLNNGIRFETYAIEGKEGSGEVCLLGGAARLGEIGDRIIIISYAFCTDDEKLKSKLILVDEHNKLKK